MLQQIAINRARPTSLGLVHQGDADEPGGVSAPGAAPEPRGANCLEILALAWPCPCGFVPVLGLFTPD